MHNKLKPDYLLIGHSRVNLKLLASLFAKGVLTRKSRIATVVIDEGIGTYAGFAYRFQAFCRESKPGLFEKFLYCLVYPVNQQLLKSRYVIDYDWRLIHRKVFGELSLNDLAISYYRDTFQLLGTSDIKNYNRPNILLITQPLVALGLVRLNEYQDILSRLRDMAKTFGLSVMVKCHPAEEQTLYDDYNFKLAESTGTAETIISQLQPGLILGLSSTALINSCVMFKIKSYSILKLLPGCNKLYDQLFRDTNIRRIYKEYVHFVDSWTELAEILSRLAPNVLGTGKQKQDL